MLSYHWSLSASHFLLASGVVFCQRLWLYCSTVFQWNRRATIGAIWSPLLLPGLFSHRVQTSELCLFVAQIWSAHGESSGVQRMLKCPLPWWPPWKATRLKNQLDMSYSHSEVNQKFSYQTLRERSNPSQRVFWFCALKLRVAKWGCWEWNMWIGSFTVVESREARWECMRCFWNHVSVVFEKSDSHGRKLHWPDGRDRGSFPVLV